MATGEIKKTVGNVVFENGDSLKHFMDTNIHKLVPELTKKKVLSKKLSKAYGEDTDLLLAHMKHKMSLDKFLGYLEIVTEFGSYEGHDGETRKMMRVMSASLEAMRPEPGSRHAEVIGRFISVARSEKLQSQTEQTLQVEGSQTQPLDQIEITSSQSTGTEERAQVEDATIKETTTESIMTMSEPSTEGSTAAESDSPLLHTGAPHRPPPGQLGYAVSYTFTHEGGVLYSPVHGVSVTIPPNAIPGHVGKFFLSMHFYLGHPFTLKEDVNICSVVVWFHLHPPIKFLEDVTVEIPHAARANLTSLCVLTWGEDKQGPLYKLNTEVPADFSDSYHAVFKVRHFSPYAIARTTSRYGDSYKNEILHKARKKAFRKRAGTGSGSGSGSGSFKSLERMNSDSIDKSFEEGLIKLVGRSGSAESDSKPKQLPRQEAIDRDLPAASSLERGPNAMRYSVSCGMPRDRSGGLWEVNIAACYSHPTGNWLLRKFAEEKVGSELQFYLKDAEIQSGCIQLSLGGHEQTPWTVEPPAGQVITEDQIQNAPEISFSPNHKMLMFSKSSYPPNVSFTVSQNRENDQPAGQLNCWIEAQGTHTVSGETLTFPLTSTKPINKGERALYTCAYLYGENNDVMETLGNTEYELVLNTQDPNHIKLLADISLQLSPEQLQALSESGVQGVAKDCFEIVSNWVCRKQGYARLKDFLQELGYSSIVLKEETPSPLLNNHLDKQPISCGLFTSLALKVRACWKEVGCLMGIPLLDLITIERENSSDLYVRSYQLLCQWQRRYDNEATYGTLFKAIHRVFDYNPYLVNDAHNYCVCHINNHPELQSPIPPPS